MRKVVFITVMFAFAFAATPVMADPFGHGDGYYGGTADWDRNGGYYAGGGGEFTIWGDDLGLSNSAYVYGTTSGLEWDSIGGSESFQSFCVEMGERIYEPMRIWVSEEWAGHESVDNGSGSHAWYGGESASGGDNLDPMTAFLYTKFATGSLATLGYNYTPGVNRQASAAALQNVIWGIEGELSSWDPSSLSGLEKDFYDDANNAVNIAKTWSGIGNVRVLQTYKQDGECFELKQDQLYLTPAPGAVLLGMLGLGVAGLKLRKFA